MTQQKKEQEITKMDDNESNITSIDISEGGNAMTVNHIMIHMLMTLTPQNQNYKKLNRYLVERKIGEDILVNSLAQRFQVTAEGIYEVLHHAEGLNIAKEFRRGDEVGFVVVKDGYHEQTKN